MSQALPLTSEHAALLDRQAITPAVVLAAGIRSAVTVDELPAWARSWGEKALPAVVFPWRSPTGLVVEQIRPDTPVTWKGEPHKYLWPKGIGVVLNVGREVPGAGTALIVEGTKQTWAAVSWAPQGIAVYGIGGCRNWSSEGIPIADLTVLEGCHVVVALDADVSSNLDVYTAAIKIGAAVKAEGAASVAYLRIPAGGTAGLDDVLGERPADKRTTYLQRLISLAHNKPADVKPRASKLVTDDADPAAVFFHNGEFQVQRLATVVREVHPVALTQERKIALYRDGVYHIDGAAFTGAISALLGNRFRPSHRYTLEEFLIGTLYNAKMFLPMHIDVPLLNVSNGMLDLVTGALKAHDPSYLSSQQIPVAWDPDACCPTYEKWAAEMVGSQLDDLEEVAATMLDPSRTPAKAAFLFGPSRSGKSTCLRLWQAVAGPSNVSAVTLHQLGANRFAAANVYGKLLNCAADLSSAHVEDISIFKMMTGEDPIQADRKYGGQFTFTNRALFAFSANELPTVGESSRAYSERIKPFEFGHSFAGREDPEIEEMMMCELPGIVGRLVRAWQRMHARGGYLPTDPRVRQEFETRSDRVRQWVAEACRVWMEAPVGRNGALEAISPGMYLPTEMVSLKRDLARGFNRWAEENSGSRMGERKIVERLTSINGVYEVRRLVDKVRGLNVTGRCDADVWDDEEAGEAVSDPTLVHSGENIFPTRRAMSEKLGVVNSPEVSRVGVETASPASTATTPPVSPPAVTAEYPRHDVAAYAGKSAVRFTPGVMAFDIEGASADEFWTGGPDFVRLCGYQQGDRVRLTTDPAQMLELLTGARMIIGHNIMAYDLLAFARLHGLDLRALAEAGRVIDTKLTAILTDPPPAQAIGGQVQRAYSLESLGQAYFEGGKSGDLKALAKEFGGFDKIPVDDQRYGTYCAADVDLTARLAAVLPRTPYAIREHRVAAIAAQIRLNGFRVDVDLLTRRVAAAQARRDELITQLIDTHGLPTTDSKGKPVAYPHRTKDGKAKLFAAFDALGVTLPKTPKGEPSLGGAGLDELAEKYAEHAEVLALIEPIKALNGVRSVYETVEKHLVGDRVHPEIDMFQASGRWSTKDPGLTVMGKRGGRHVEREIFLPDPGHVIISADLSQIDARAIAAWSQDPNYLALFEPGIDSHREVARMVWGDESRRDDAKAIGHGWNYGMSIAGLARNAKVDIEVAKEFDRAMREQFPDLVEWRTGVRRQAEAGERLNNGFGRLMNADPQRAWTQGPALMGQGTARDLMMEGLLRLPAQVLPMLRAVVHDEIILSAPAADADDVERAVIAALQFPWAPPGASRPVQIEAGLGKRRGCSWGHVYAPEEAP